MSINEEKIVNKKPRRIINIGNALTIDNSLKGLGENYIPKNRRESFLTFNRDVIAYIKIYTDDIEYTYAIHDAPRFVNNPKEVIEDIIDYHRANYPSKPIQDLIIFTLKRNLRIFKDFYSYMHSYAFLRIFTLPTHLTPTTQFTLKRIFTLKR